MIRALIAVALLAPLPAHADWPSEFYSYNDGEYHSAKRRRYLARPYTPPVRAWIQRDRYDTDERDSPRQCYDAVTVVGETAHSDERARNNAIAAFAQIVRWRHGERALDVKNARNVTFTCSQASIPLTGGTARAVDAAAERLLNKTTDEIRCELRANPCRAHAGDKGQ